MWEGWGGPGREDESVVLVKAVLYGTLFSFLLTLLSVCRLGLLIRLSPLIYVCWICCVLL